MMTDYTYRDTLSQVIISKLKDGKELTSEELDYVKSVLEDPLGEFCAREGTFRLVEILDLHPTRAIQIGEQAAEIVRDNIDYNENLYDSIDDDLRNLIAETED